MLPRPHPTPLKFLSPAWFSVVMGLCGLALAWLQAEPLMGEPSVAIAWALGALAAGGFVVLLGASALRLQRHPQAWREDTQHPVRHAFVATLPAAVLLLASVATGLMGPHPLIAALWWLGSIGQFAVLVWVLSRWWQGNQPQGLSWAGITPVLFIPVVGNVLVPLAGVPLGQAHWAAAQFGIGVLFWPVILTLIGVRLAQQGLWPQRLAPSVFIVLAPPSVIGAATLQLGGPELLAWMCWGIALCCFFWAARQAGAIVDQAFSIGHWGVSFPLAAWTGLTLRLSHGEPLLRILGPALLALTSLVVVALILGTVRGLRQGTLLAPEPVAMIQPVSVPSGQHHPG